MKRLEQLNLKNKKYIIFDVDGTLVDSIGAWNKAEQKIIKELAGRDVDLDTIHEERQNFLHSQSGGDVYMKYCRYLIERYGLNVESVESLSEMRVKTANDILAEEVCLKPRAAEVILRLRSMGMKIILATMATRRQTGTYFNNQRVMDQLDMLYVFDSVITVEDVHNKKPDPEIYNKILDHYHASPEECLIFEDSYSGVLAGKRAGIEVINIPDKYSASEQEKTDQIADYKISSYGEMLEYLNRDRRRCDR